MRTLFTSGYRSVQAGSQTRRRPAISAYADRPVAAKHPVCLRVRCIANIRRKLFDLLVANTRQLDDSTLYSVKHFEGLVGNSWLVALIALS